MGPLQTNLKFLPPWNWLHFLVDIVGYFVEILLNVCLEEVFLNGGMDYFRLCFQMEKLGITSQKN